MEYLSILSLFMSLVVWMKLCFTWPSHYKATLGGTGCDLSTPLNFVASLSKSSLLIFNVYHCGYCPFGFAFSHTSCFYLL